MGELCDGEPLFPGESEIDQLYHVQKVLGELPDNLKELFAKNPQFIGYNFPDVGKPETLEKRYVGKLSKGAIALMGKMLEQDPRKRITAIDALADPYFESIREQDIEELIQKYKEK